MIDLHTHILPGIDDGAGTWDEAIEMCRLAAADGCTGVVATPHQRKAWPNEDTDRLRSLVDELQQRAGPKPKIWVGGEIHVGVDILDDLERPGLGGLAPLADSRALLLEFGLSQPPMGASALIHELVLAEWQPVIAHPEFIPFLAEDLELMDELVVMGARAQATAMSVTGKFGRRIQASVRTMIDRGLIHFVASDAHSPTWRSPGLSEARDEISRRWGRAVADRLTDDYPASILAGRDIPLDPLA